MSECIPRFGRTVNHRDQIILAAFYHVVLGMQVFAGRDTALAAATLTR
jgi:hypothetical protein